LPMMPSSKRALGTESHPRSKVKADLTNLCRRTWECVFASFVPSDPLPLPSPFPSPSFDSPPPSHTHTSPAVANSDMIAFFFLFCLLELAIFSVPAHGQSTTVVTTVSSPAYARSGSKLYVVGGGYEREVKTSSSFFYNSPTFVVGDGQFIVLDLSVSWKGSAPAWKKLKNGPIQYGFPGAISADGNKMVTFHSSDNNSSSFAMLYDVQTDTWSPSKVQVPLANRTGVGAVLNPLDGQVYLPSGYENTLGDQMYIYNFDTDTMSKKPMSGPLTDALYYNGVWNSKTQTMLFFGGRVYPSGSYAPGSIFVYTSTPSTDSWSSLVGVTVICGLIFFLFVFAVELCGLIQ